MIYTDSMYVHDGVYQAEVVWPKTGWLTREGEPVLSPDLWKELVRLKRRVGRVEFRRVQAHKTNPHNTAVDTLARESARLANRQMLSPPAVGRKTSPRKTEPRGVRMRGHIETIRILVVRQIRGRPYHAYKYEVVAEDSPDFQAVDDAFAKDGEVDMRRAHTYEVRFREPGSGRWIDEVIREVERGHLVVVASWGAATPLYTPAAVLEHGLRRHGIEAVASGEAGTGTWFLGRKTAD